ncbi:MAG: HNH endonuclease [Mycoplasmatales bacterium]|nr:HNH endonuclease [Mycoplasmatales bacterium]
MSGNRYGDHNIKERVWSDYIGDYEKGEDAFGHEIHRSDYRKNNYYGWTIDHIWPKNPRKAKRRGSDNYKNLQPLCVDCNKTKGNDMSGECYEQSFSVQSAGTRVSDDGEERMIGRMFVDGELKTLY